MQTLQIPCSRIPHASGSSQETPSPSVKGRLDRAPSWLLDPIQGISNIRYDIVGCFIPSGLGGGKFRAVQLHCDLLKFALLLHSAWAVPFLPFLTGSLVLEGRERLVVSSTFPWPLTMAVLPVFWGLGASSVSDVRRVVNHSCDAANNNTLVMCERPCRLWATQDPRGLAGSASRWSSGHS